MIQPTALNALIVGLMAVIFLFIWNMTARALVDRNPESELGKAMAVITNVSG